ncbi:hypothetical protein BPOR_0210g00050 [Botrytis porri]|uniref:Uncharacterized protein n=1 Tax=Botrytis porri TaxID=87229 RepID=A0A4Z1KQ52_9HELO|nr:hypothetical protein BPOR_0210g00050 [Botrytis porri]
MYTAASWKKIATTVWSVKVISFVEIHQVLVGIMLVDFLVTYWPDYGMVVIEQTDKRSNSKMEQKEDHAAVQEWPKKLYKCKK